MKQQPTTQEIKDTVSDFLVKANLDMLAAVEDERYEEADMIKTSIMLYCYNQSYVFTANNGHNIAYNFGELLKISNEMFRLMSENADAINE